MDFFCDWISSRGLRESNQGRHKRASRRCALVAGIRAFLPGPDSEGRLLRRLPRAGASASLPSLSSLSKRYPLFFFPLISIQEATCIPSTRSQSYVSLRDPPPCPTPSHPTTETNDEITSPRSTDKFTRTTYALTKSKWERDRGKEMAAKYLGGFCATLKTADTGPTAVGFTASAVTVIFNSRLWRSGQPRLGEKGGHNGHR